MKRWLLYLLSSVLACWLVYSCHTDELEYFAPEGEEVSGVYGNFGIREAQSYFEQNATDLSVPRIDGRPRVKSSWSERIELIPEWDEAVRSGHSAVSLVEIPLKSYTDNTCKECLMSGESQVSDVTFQVMRRLVIARHDSCVTDMFIITVVPSMDYEGDVLKSLEDFRYLGGGDFTGTVFCTTLEGDFVKAFGYRNGRQMGRLNVIPKSRVAEAQKLHPELFSDYRVYRFLELPAVSGRTYTKSSDWGGGGTTDPGGGGGGSGSTICQHGWNIEICPTCNSTLEGGDLGEVVVTACPYCKQQNGCVCPTCFWCHKKERECSCQRCVKCHKKIMECTCFEYPDPESSCPYCGNTSCDGECRIPTTGGGGSEGEGGEDDSIPPTVTEPQVYVIKATDVLFHESILTLKRRAQRKYTNTCLVTVMEYIGELLGMNISRREYIRFFQKNLSDKIKYNIDGTKRGFRVRERGVPNTEIPKGLYHFFGQNGIGNIAYGGNAFSYTGCIDSGNMVLTNVQVTDIGWHSLLVIGYTKEGNMIYIDPLDKDNFYVCPPQYLESTDSYKFNFEIKSKK